MKWVKRQLGVLSGYIGVPCGSVSPGPGLLALSLSHAVCVGYGILIVAHTRCLSLMVHTVPAGEAADRGPGESASDGHRAVVLCAVPVVTS